MTTININMTECGCESWGCEDCFSVVEKPTLTHNLKKIPDVNPWSTLVQIQPATPRVHDLDVEAVVKRLLESSDNNWSTTDNDWKIVTKKHKKGPKNGDRLLMCKTCSQNFNFPVHQQRQYKERQWNQPKICGDCMQKRHNNR